MARVFRIVAGSTLVLTGTAMLVLPGPGLVTLAAGLALLSKDVPAASRLKDRVTSRFLPAPKDYADRV
ncbi:MAG: PGPGW domain-containing protein [Actinobacteria bacterium]|nr:PGPGW domain-containing protein [Actinomycetota bacterium]